jgi:hypothetical protein
MCCRHHGCASYGAHSQHSLYRFQRCVDGYAIPQIKYETFLEDVNNILTSGEVPNLFPKDELGGLLDELRPAAKAAGAGETHEQLMTFFLERVR